MKPILATLLLGTLLAAPAPAAEYTLAQYMAIRRAGTASFAPDGRSIAYLTNTSGNWQVWTTPTAKSQPKQLTKFSGGVGNAQWSPTGEKILAVADRDGDQKYQFYTVNARTSEVTRLTEGVDTRNSFGGWMPDGAAIFYTSNARDRKYFDLYVMEVGTRRAEMVYQRDALMRAKAVSRDGRLIAVEQVLSPVDNHILVVNVHDRTARSITPHEGSARFATIGFSPDAETLYCRSNVEGEYMSVLALRVADGARSLVVGGARDVDDAVLDRAGARLALTENVDGFEELSVWDLATRQRLPLPSLPKGIAFPQQFSADGARLAYTLNTPVHDDEVWIVDLARGKSSRATFSPDGGIAESDCIPAEIIRYPSFDGRTIPALLYVPPGCSPQRRAPVIVSIHGGPEEQEQPYMTNYYQFLVARGFAVLAPNVRGSTGFGKSYVAADNGPLRWDAMKDVAAAVGWIKRQDRLDARKVACMGASYGGFITLAMLAHHPDLFAAGVDFYGPSDLRTFLARTAEYRRPARIAEYGDPVRDSTFMAAISPAAHAGRIKAPLLVIQGANDPVVPPAESEDIVRLVREAGGTAEYLLLPDEGHGLSKDESWIKSYDQVLAFLRRHMPPPRR